MARDVIVIGGGIAGLTAAWKLQRGGADVELLEADPSPGGNVQSEVLEGFRVERGPHTFMASADAIFELIDEVGLGEQLVASREAASARHIAREGRLHALPSGLWSFLGTSLLSWSSKWFLATEPLRTRRGEPSDSAQQFFERRFGPEAARVLAGAFISGVYAGDPAALSAPAAFPLFWGFEQEGGSMIRGAMRHMKRRKASRAALGEAAPPRRKGLYSLHGGLGTLTSTLAARLGERCRLGMPVEAVGVETGGFVVHAADGEHRARQVVIAAPPPAASHMLGATDARIAELLDGIPLAPIAVVHLGFDERQATVPESFGFLIPRGEGVRTLGVLFPSRLFEDRTPAGGDLLTGYVGGALDREALDLDDAALAKIVRDDLHTLCGLKTAPTMVRVVRHRHAIPQLVAGHLERIDELRQRLRALPGLQLAGNYLHGVGIKDAVRAGIEAAQAALDQPVPVARVDAPAATSRLAEVAS